MSVEPLPSATVVLVRDGEGAIELLLLERRVSRDGRRGPWVFPGGKIDAADRAGQPEGVEASARLAAVRETREEAGLEISDSSLVPISRWITPEIASRRFDTWFFLCPVDRREEVRVDGTEICGHRWLTPGSALDGHRLGEIRLAPPTFVTVSWMGEYASTADALRSLAREPILTFRPRICSTPDGGCLLYPGDAGYEDGEAERPGPRHRLWILPGGWRYESSGRRRSG